MGTFSDMSISTEVSTLERRASELAAVRERIKNIRVELKELSIKARRLRSSVRNNTQRRDGNSSSHRCLEKLQAESKKTASNQCTRWSDAELSFVLKNTGKMTRLDIAKALGRTLKSVKSKMYLLRQDPTVRAK